MNGDGEDERNEGECRSGRGPVTEKDKFIVADSASVSTSGNSNDSDVWLSQTSMKNIGIWSLDFILLKGQSNKKMICSVRAIEDDKCGKGQILMNSVIRKNLGVSIEDKVSYEYPITVERGSKVVVSPIHAEIARQPQDFLLKEYIGPFFKRRNTVVHEGNIFTTPSIHGGECTDFKIIRTTPSPFCEVGPGVIYAIEFGAHQKRSCEMDANVSADADADSNNRDSKDVKLVKRFSHSKAPVMKNEIVWISTVKPEDANESSVVTSSENSSNEVISSPRSDQVPAPALVLTPLPPPPPPPLPTSTASPLSENENETESLDSSDQNYDVADHDNSQPIPIAESSQRQQIENAEPGSGCDTLDGQATSLTRPKPKPKQKRVPALPIRGATRRPSRLSPGPAENWLSQIIFKRNPYFPQIRDDLVYLRQAHELFVRTVTQKTNTSTSWLNYKLTWKMKKEAVLPYVQYPNLSAAEGMKVIGIEFAISNNCRFVKLQLALTDWDTGVHTGTIFDVAYKNMDGVPDFLVLRQIYDRSLNQDWNVKDKFRFMGPSENSWVVGTVVKKVHQRKFPQSHFQTFLVQWNGTKYRRALSPWDMEPIPPDFEVHSPLPPNPYYEVPASEIDVNLSKNGVYEIHKEDWPPGSGPGPGRGQEGECARISKVISQVITKLPLSRTFHNILKKYAGEVAYPVDLHLIRARLDQLFYRRPAAIRTDIENIGLNATQIFGPASDDAAAAAAAPKNAQLMCELLKEVVANPNILDISDCKSVLISATNSLPVEEDAFETETIHGPDSDPVPDTPPPSVSVSAKLRKKNNSRAAVAVPAVATDPQKSSQKRPRQTGTGSAVVVGEKMTEMGGSVNKKYRKGLRLSELNIIDLTDDDDDCSGNDIPQELN